MFCSTIMLCTSYTPSTSLLLKSKSLIKLKEMISQYKLVEGDTTVKGINSQFDKINPVFFRHLQTARNNGECFTWPYANLCKVSSMLHNLPEARKYTHVIWGSSNKFSLSKPEPTVYINSNTTAIQEAILNHHSFLNLVFDIEIPLKKAASKLNLAKGADPHVVIRETLSRILTLMKDYITKAGEEIDKQLVLHSPSLTKVSFHVHIQLKNAYFASVQAIKSFVSVMSSSIPEIDMALYRNHAHCRIYQSKKSNGTSALVVYRELPGCQINVDLCNQVDIMKFSLIVTCPYAMISSLKNGDNFKVINSVSSQKSTRRAPVKTTLHSEITFKNLTLKKALSVLPSLVDKIPLDTLNLFSTWIIIGLLLKQLSISITNVVQYNKEHINSSGSNTLMEDKQLIDNLSTRDLSAEFLQLWDEASMKIASKYQVGDCQSRWNKLNPNKYTTVLEVPSKSRRDVLTPVWKITFFELLRYSKLKF